MKANLAAAGLGALLLAAAPTAQSIVGLWYEEARYPDGTFVISIADFHADGTYTVTFRHCLPQGPSDRTQLGHWSFANGTMHITKEFGPYRFVYATEDYATNSFDGRVWEYRFVRGSDLFATGPGTFRDTRVAPDSRVPDCNATS